MRVELAEPNRFTRMLSYRYDRQDIPTITRITIDSRKVQPGDLFVPIAGSRVDGHDLAAQAVEAGAVALLVERKIPPLPTDPPVVMVADTIQELGSIAKSWRGTYTQPLVAITGSNGKTTTKNPAVEVLPSKYDVLGTEGSYNSSIGPPLTRMRLAAHHHIDAVSLGSLIRSTDQSSKIATVFVAMAGRSSHSGDSRLSFSAMSAISPLS